MPIDQAKLEAFDEKFPTFDRGQIGRLHKSDFMEFLNFFTVGGSLYEGGLPDGEEEDSEDDGEPIAFVGVQRYTQKLANYLWKSLDIKNEDSISKKLALYCLKGLSGYFQDFTLQVLFRVLDSDHDGLISNNELRQMKKLNGMPLSEDEMIKKFEKKLGKEIDEVDYKTFYFLFKNREADSDDTAYDPDLFDIEIDQKKEGCCLLI